MKNQQTKPKTFKNVSDELIVGKDNYKETMDKNVDNSCTEKDNRETKLSGELKRILTILYTHRDKLIDDNYNHEHYEDCSICGNIDLLNQLISEVRSIHIQQDLKVDCCNSPVENNYDKFNLSNEIFPEGSNPWGFKYGFIDTEDVKEFTKLLKEEIKNKCIIGGQCYSVGCRAGLKIAHIIRSIGE